MTTNSLQLTQVPVMKQGMLIRKPPAEVFHAFVDPGVTTKFWFTRSSGKLAPGAKVRWDWEMYGVGSDVVVTEFQENSRLVFTWGDPAQPTTVELRFVPYRDVGTYVQITESGYTGTGDQLAARVADSTGGFSFLLASSKAYLEHNVVLTVVLDHVPPGLQL